MKVKLKFLLNLLLTYSKRANIAGFTLVEMLVTILISGIIITGLLAVVIELLTTNNQEIARTETQREMQMALDFIGSDLREAVHVYDGECLQQKNDPVIGANGSLCSGLFKSGTNAFTVPANSTPVLAFWKLDELPDAVKTVCANPNSVDSTGTPIAVDSNTHPYPCLAGRSYTLVVYFLTQNQSGTSWSGRARIQRLELPAYNSSGQPIQGYADPNLTSFSTWPYSNGGDMRTTFNGTATAPAATTLVDFVDNRAMSAIPELAANAAVACPTGYALTPDDDTLAAYGFTNVRNFYGCVKIPDNLITGSTTATTGSFNQKVILFLRGNAYGKPGIKEVNEGFLPAIATQVLNRGVKDKEPPKD